MAGLFWHFVAGVELNKEIVKLGQIKEEEYQQRLSGQEDKVRRKIYNRHKKAMSSYENIARELKKELEKEEGKQRDGKKTGAGL